MSQEKWPDLKVFSGRANEALALEVCKLLQIELGIMYWTDFEGDEMKPQYHKSIRGKKLFIIQPTVSAKFREELILMLDAARRASAKEITAVIPCFGYQRQERKTEPRVPISAKVFLDCFVVAGAQRFVFVDLHAEAIQGFVNVPVDHLWAMPTLLKEKPFRQIFDTHGPKNIVFVADLGQAKIVSSYAKQFGCEVVFAYKRGRDEGADYIKEVILVGEVKDNIVIILDDIIKTAGTMSEIAEACRKAGATKVFGGGIHGELVGNALRIIEESCLESVIVTNSVHIPQAKRIPKLRIVSIAGLLARAIKEIYEHGSVSKLFSK